MEITFRAKFFELCLRTSKTYSVYEERFLNPMVATRFGKYAWSTAKGWRKLGAEK